MKSVLQCVFNGLKTTIDAMLALALLIVPPYLTLEVSLWFAPLVVIEVLFFVGAVSGGDR